MRGNTTKYSKILTRAEGGEPNTNIDATYQMPTKVLHGWPQQKRQVGRPNGNWEMIKEVGMGGNYMKFWPSTLSWLRASSGWR
jgi:hypothetical protein